MCKKNDNLRNKLINWFYRRIKSFKANILRTSRKIINFIKRNWIKKIRNKIFNWSQKFRLNRNRSVKKIKLRLLRNNYEYVIISWINWRKKHCATIIIQRMGQG